MKNLEKRQIVLLGIVALLAVLVIADKQRRKNAKSGKVKAGFWSILTGKAYDSKKKELERLH